MPFYAQTAKRRKLPRLIDRLMDNEYVVYTFQLKKNVATWIKRKDITLRDIS